ncbi:MAG: hypothetical protein ACO20H_08675, partial [Bacteriovoracaceae bacterium]
INGDTASVTDSLFVDINAVADAPNLSMTDAAGDEDTVISLDIASSLNDLDGSESLGVVISGVPTGASLSAGTDNGDGTWTLTESDLTGLTITPPSNSDTDFNLTVTATATDSNGDTSSVSGNLFVDLNAVADAPTLVVTDTIYNSTTPVALDISSALTDLDGSETLEVVISDVPTGGSLSAGTDNGDGTWTLSESDLDGLTFTAPAGSSEDISLSISATATEANGSTNTINDTLLISEYTSPVADINYVNLVGNENLNIDLPLDIDLVGGDGTETYTIDFSGLPTGFTLSAGTDLGGGSWSLTSADLSSLQIIPPANTETDFVLDFNVTVTDSFGNTQDYLNSINVEMNPEGNLIETFEDTSVSISIHDFVDTSTAVETVISGYPDGTTFSVGTDNGDGTWTIDASDFNSVSITPPTDESTDYTLNFEAFKAVGKNGSKLVSVDSQDVTLNIEAVADAPDLTVMDISTEAGQDINLDISSSLTDTDGSEDLSLVISGLADGVTLSAGTENADGSWTLNADELDGLQASIPEGLDTDFTVHVESTSEEFTSNDTATVSDDFTISIIPTNEN